MTEAARPTYAYRQGFPNLCLLYAAAAAGLTTARLALEDSTRFTFMQALCPDMDRLL